MTNDATLELTGSVPTTTNISLSTTASGWNLVGYPSDENRGMPEALTEHGVSDYNLVYAYHADETDTWKRYAPGVPGKRSAGGGARLGLLDQGCNRKHLAGGLLAEGKWDRSG